MADAEDNSDLVTGMDHRIEQLELEVKDISVDVALANMAREASIL